MNLTEGKIIGWDDKNKVWYIYHFDHDGNLLWTQRIGDPQKLLGEFAGGDGKWTSIEYKFEQQALQQVVNNVTFFGDESVLDVPAENLSITTTTLTVADVMGRFNI